MSAAPRSPGSFESTSPESTRRLGACLARSLPDGAVVALIGELGAGKTALVQGAADGLGARARCDDGDEGATSPTFVLVREYEGSGRRIVHVDAHRMRSAAELRDIGSDDFLGRGAIAFVEWADRVEAALPRPYLAIHLRHAGETLRRVTWEGVGPGGEALARIAARACAEAGRGMGTP